MIRMILYEEEVSGALWPEKVNTRGPRAVTWYHVHVAELKETAQVPPPYQQKIIPASPTYSYFLLFAFASRALPISAFYSQPLPSPTLQT